MPVSETVEVAVRDFRAHLSSYLEIAGSGSVVVVTAHGKPVARLVPPEPLKIMPFGALAGRIRIADDFDVTQAEIIDMMEGGSPPFDPA